MKTEQHHFIVKSKGHPPTVEVDTQAAAVYVRFNKSAVARTIPQECAQMHIAIDVDSKGEVVGIEAVGITEFSLGFILAKAGVKAPEMDFSRARYIPAAMVPA